jgi:glucose-6-phosphate 1-dehydrogenase
MTHAIRKKSKAEPAPPTTLFLFGAHGDLVKRLLMPALYNLSRDGLLGDGLRIIGVDHNAITDEAFARKLEDFIRSEMAAKSGKGDQALDPQVWAKLAKGISYVQGDFLDDSVASAPQACWWKHPTHSEGWSSKNRSGPICKPQKP